jgi:glycosyltransferase involved in cell wall biosynthesis
MRIAFVAWQGSEHTRRWAGFFAERGHDVHVVTCGDAPADGKEASSSYGVHDIGEPRFGKPGYLLKIPLARRLIRSLAPDVVHAHHATSYGLLAAMAGVHPLVVTCHGSDVLISGKQAVSRAVLRRVFDAADLITAPGQHVADAVRTLGTTTEIAVFQYGVDVDRLRAVAAATRRTSARTPDRIRLVTARGLDALYRIDDVIRAMAILRERGLECVYDVAGRGTELADLRRLSQEIGIADQVIFHGHLAESEAERLIAEADVYVSVAESDGVSIALLEAMALGPIPVLSDIPANRLWVRDGVNGLLVDMSPVAIADGITRALELDRAEVRRRNLGIVRELGDRDTNLASCEALISELVTRSGSTAALGA